MNIEQEIRAQIEKNKGLRLEISGINNHLSILEGMCRVDAESMKRKISDAYSDGYKAGYNKGYTDKENNDEVCKELVSDIHDKAYQQGLDDAWHVARKIELNVLPNGELGLLGKEMKSIFGSTDVCIVFETFTASEAIEAIKAYDEKKDDEIRVGDVVVCRTTDEKGIATRVDNVGANVLLGSGHTGYYTFNLLEKTNKHNSSIKAILKRIIDENN